ncbi:MAG: acyl-CoA dehydrogenase family protein [Labilithrix sp.]|nr:acyl-CoA dehydrogenase family protein [Labilithrix sp.]
MISFQPTEDQKLMVESVAQFARTTLRPKIRDFEKARELPEAVRRTAHELGLGLVALPESVSGAGLGLTTAVLLEEELAWGDPSAPFALGGPGAFGLAVVELGTEEQAQKALAPFAADGAHARFGAVAWGERKPNVERAGLSTTATKKGDDWQLDGAKAYVVNADRAEHFVVFAQVDPGAGWRGVGAFLVDRGAPGLTVTERATTLGLDAASFGGLELSGVVVPASARLAGGADFDAALVRFFAKNALLVAARGVGLSRAAFEVTREYVDGRKAFGKPIGHFQAVAFTVADRAMDVDASRGLVWRAAAAWDAFARGEGSERDALLLTAQAIAFGHEAAMRCGDDGVQLHGGAGFMRDYPVEKLMRDAKQLGLCGMTAEHADQLAAAVTLGAPIDPGLVLPTPETQSAFV